MNMKPQTRNILLLGAAGVAAFFFIKQKKTAATTNTAADNLAWLLAWVPGNVEPGSKDYVANQFRLMTPAELATSYEMAKNYWPNDPPAALVPAVDAILTKYGVFDYKSY